MDVGQGREQDAEALLVTYLEPLQKRHERFWAQAPMGWDTWMYLTNRIPRALIGAFSVTTEAAMKDQQTLGWNIKFKYRICSNL